MRLFVAIELDETARAHIAAEQRRLRTAFGDRAALRWVQPSHMHLTLVFLGELDDPAAARVVEAMRSPVDLSPFRLHFGGVGVFPPRGAPRVLWLGATRGADKAIALQAIVAARIAGCGIPADERPFRPHLTLARWRNGRSPKGLRGAGLERSAGAAAREDTAAIDVHEVTLFRSDLSSAAPTYTPLARAPLAGPTPPLQ